MLEIQAIRQWQRMNQAVFRIGMIPLQRHHRWPTFRCTAVIRRLRTKGILQALAPDSHAYKCQTCDRCSPRGRRKKQKQKPLSISIYRSLRMTVRLPHHFSWYDRTILWKYIEKMPRLNERAWDLAPCIRIATASPAARHWTQDRSLSTKEQSPSGLITSTDVL